MHTSGRDTRALVTKVTHEVSNDYNDQPFTSTSRMYQYTPYPSKWGKTKHGRTNAGKLVCYASSSGHVLFPHLPTRYYEYLVLRKGRKC